MKLSHLPGLWLGAFFAWILIVLLGWTLAFAFSYKVLIPWLGCVPEQYHRLAALASAFVFDGLGSLLVMLVCALIGLAIFHRIYGRKKPKFY